MKKIGVFDEDGNCRSIGYWQEYGKDYFWYFTVVGNEEEDERKELHFKLYNKKTDSSYRAEETIFFADNITLGTPDEPILLNSFIREEGEAEISTSNELYQNYPNPISPRFNRGSTKISFSIPKDVKNAEIKIYNIKGQLVKKISIYNDQSSVVWNGKNEKGEFLSNGIYLYKLKAGNNSVTKRMVLMR